MPKHKQDDAGVAVLVEQVELSYLGLDKLYPGTTDAVIQALDTMYRSKHIAVKGIVLPQDAIRARLMKLSPEAILHTVTAFTEACRTRLVLNPQRYLMSAIYESPGMVTLKDMADFQRLERFTE